MKFLISISGIISAIIAGIVVYHYTDIFDHDRKQKIDDKLEEIEEKIDESIEKGGNDSFPTHSPELSNVCYFYHPAYQTTYTCYYPQYFPKGTQCSCIDPMGYVFTGTLQ